VGIVPKSNRKIRKTEAKSIPQTHKYMTNNLSDLEQTLKCKIGG
jgi:hypothetical protein